MASFKRPALVFYGDAPLEGVLQGLARPLLAPAGGREVMSFPGTDHFYKGRIDTVTAAIKTWLLKHTPPK